MNVLPQISDPRFPLEVVAVALVIALFVLLVVAIDKSKSRARETTQHADEVQQHEVLVLVLPPTGVCRHRSPEPAHCASCHLELVSRFGRSEAARIMDLRQFSEAALVV